MYVQENLHSLYIGWVNDNYQWAQLPFFDIAYNLKDATILTTITTATSTAFSVNS